MKKLIPIILLILILAFPERTESFFVGIGNIFTEIFTKLFEYIASIGQS